MKQFLLLIFLVSFSSVFSQDLTSSIPGDALIVATVKGENLTQLMSIDEINNSYVGKEILKDFSRKQETPFASLADLGFNLEASSHYFLQANDSVRYNVFVVPIKNSSQLEALLVSKNEMKIVSKDGFKILEDEKKTDVVIVWNDSKMLMVMGEVSDRYFEEKEVMERYGLQDLYDYSYDIIEEAEDYGDYVVEEAYPEDSEDIEETVIESTENDVEEVEEPVLMSPPPPVAPTSPETEIAEDVYEDEYEDEDEYDDSYYSDYSTKYNTNYDIKKGLEKEWSMAQAIRLMTQSSSQSIVSNKSYMSSLDKNAEATLWVGDFSKIYDNLMGGMYYADLMGFNFGSMYADSEMSAKLYAEKDEMRLNTSYTMSESMADSYKKMMDQKLNRKFFDYINEDRMIGYMSYAMNTEEALKEYPKILKNLYGNMPMYGEEASLGVDLFELLLDEEAVAKVLPGDMLFLLSGISEKEMTYKTYNYNDDFEYEEIEKTKKETVPDFLMMITSEDQNLIKKLMNYGIKKEVIEAKNGYYSMVIPESPLSVFMAFKDDIVFIGTSEIEMSKIVRGTFDSKLSSKHKKLLKNSNYAAYLSGKQLASKIPMDELGEKEMTKLNWFLQNSEDAYISSSKMKGNVIEADMVIGVPASQENSLKYIFNMIETFAK
ncbi:MAG: hypothetical protein ACSHXF_03245 [Aquaticitalea sp.]